MSRFTRICGWLLCLALLGAMAACQTGGANGAERGTAASSAKERPTVKVAINTWPGLGPFYVARAKGFDHAESVALEVQMTENAEARTSSLVSGEIDLVGITLDAVVVARSKGVPMVVVGQSDFSFGGDGIIAKKEIKSVADLKGKRVACAEGMPSHFLLLYLLRKNRLSHKDIQLVPADDGGQAAFLFTSGNVDAAVTWDPWISKAESLTEGHVLITTRETPRLVLGIVAANPKLLPTRRDNIARAMRAWFKAVDYVRRNPDDAAAIMAKEYNVPVPDFKRMAAGAQLADLEETRRTFGTASMPGPIRQLAIDASDIWLAAGVIQRPVAPEDAVDWTVVQSLSLGE